ncbi:uncharacterized protein AAGF69_015316 isoform 1-T1 [Amazona ochrocephala]
MERPGRMEGTGPGTPGTPGTPGIPGTPGTPGTPGSGRSECAALPPGWRKEEVIRKSGLSAGKSDVYYYSGKSGRAPHGSPPMGESPSRPPSAIPLLHGVLHGLQVDPGATVDLHGLQEDTASPWPGAPPALCLFLVPLNFTWFHMLHGAKKWHWRATEE